MADEKLATVVTPVEDQELNDLLDSALESFIKEQKVNEVDEKKESLAVTTNEENFETLEDVWTANIIEGAADRFNENLQNIIKTGKVDEKNKSSALGTNKDSFKTIDNAWSTNIIGEAIDQFEEHFQTFIKNGPDSELGASFKKMAQTLTSVVSEDGNVDKDGASTDFETVIARALNDLSATSQTLQSEADISEMLGQASLDDGPGAILPMIQGMLQHLVSKDILYPSLKELVDKYAEWLEVKETSISPDDLQRFTKQLDLIRLVCSELDKEKNNDTKETKKKHFEKVVSLMQLMQETGPLPEELVGEHTMPFQGDAENCQLM